MPRLIICRGIPGSGKSYWAAKMKLHGLGSVEVVTRDDIRIEYGCIGAGWSKDKEIDYVIPEMNNRIRAGLQAGKIVISADTNINPVVVEKLIALSRKCGADYEIKYFDAPVEICIERDAQREAPWKVGADKIREYQRMYEQIIWRELMNQKVAWQLIDSDITRYSFKLNMSEYTFKTLMIQKNLNPYQVYEFIWKDLVTKGHSVPPLESCPDYYL